MGELLQWLLEHDNRNTCRIVGLFCTITSLVFFYFYYGAYPQDVEGQGWIFSASWFREVFQLAMVLMFFVGILLAWAGFTRRKDEE